MIVGAGRIGMLHMQLARNRGARLIVSDPIAARLERARTLGAHDVIDASATDPIERVKELTGGRGADAVEGACRSGSCCRSSSGGRCFC